MKTKKIDIYFVPSYVCLQNFLSVIDLRKKNLIFCSNNEDLYKFLLFTFQNFDVELIKLDVALSKGREADETINNFITRLGIEDNIEKIDKIFYFCKEWTLGFFILIDRLKNYGTVIFINSESDNFESKYEMKNLRTVLFYLKIKYYSIIFRINLIPVLHKDDIILTIRYNENFSEKIKYYNPLTWNEIKGKINLKFTTDKCVENKSILFIHHSLKSMSVGININRTFKNIYKLLKEFEDNGYKIYIKGHPAHNIRKEFKRFTVIPSFIPVEFMEKDYDLYFTIYSLGIREFLITGKAYSLINYLEFENLDLKKILLSFLNENLKGINILDYKEKIE